MFVALSEEEQQLYSTIKRRNKFGRVGFAQGLAHFKNHALLTQMELKGPYAR